MDDKYLISAPAVPAQTKSFGGLEEEYSSFKKSKIAIMQVPYDKTATYIKGTKHAPRAIIDASAYLERFDDELNQETFKIGIHTMDSLSVENLPPEEMAARVNASTSELLKAGKFPVILGGEHSVSIGAVKAFKEV